MAVRRLRTRVSTCAFNHGVDAVLPAPNRTEGTVAIRARAVCGLGWSGTLFIKRRLPTVTPKQAIPKYKGDPAEAERALAAVLHVANKALAQITSAPGGSIDIDLLEIASRGVPAILTSYFYTPLGLNPPTPNIANRDRSDG